MFVIMYLPAAIRYKAFYANDAARPFRQCYATFSSLSSHYHLRVSLYVRVCVLL